MQRICIKAVMVGLAMVGLAGGVNSVRAQQQTLVEYTNVWKYSTNINLDAVPWRNNSYNDSAWLSGRGLLGVETAGVFPQAPINTTFSPYLQALQTYYFRTRFTFSSNPAGVTLISTNCIDDGAVLFLNGTEVGRVRVAANQTFTTGATGTGGEGVVEVITFPSGALVQGDNVLAVEVHQSGTGSSDIVWGMKLVAIIPTPITITNQPRSQTNTAGSSTTFSVGVTGTQPTYQWYSNNVAISGALSSTYTIVNTRPSHAATYHVRVSNSFGPVQSSNAVLTVVSDEAGPLLVSAIVDEITNNRVIINFSESVLRANATNTANYSISPVGSTDKLVISNNIALNVAQVRLTVSPPFMDGVDYILTVNNVTDLLTNSILPNSQIGIGSWRTLFPMTGPWLIHAYGGEPGLNGEFGPSNPSWKNRVYDDSADNAWAGHAPELLRALFYYTDDPLPAAANTSVSLGWNSYYFRGVFVVTNLEARATLRLRHVIDDGAVIYFNGNEIHRFNMPAGAITYDTFATPTVGVAALSGPYLITVSNLVSGTNVLAVEVHQADLFSSDIVFGAQVDAAFTPSLPGPFRLEIVQISPTSVRLSWTETSATLQSSINPTGGPWVNVSTAGTSHLVTPGGAPRFYRLRKPL